MVKHFSVEDRPNENLRALFEVALAFIGPLTFRDTPHFLASIFNVETPQVNTDVCKGTTHLVTDSIVLDFSQI